VTDTLRSVLRWIVGAEGAKEPDLTGDDLPLLTQASAAAFAVTVNLRFTDDVTPETVQQFVTRIRERHLQPGTLNPVLAEWFILDAFDHPVSLTDVSVTDRITTQNLIAAGVVRDMNITGDALDELVDDAIDLLAEADTEDDS